MGWGPNLFIQLGQPMKTLAATTALLGLALLPSAALADWNGQYAGVSFGTTTEGEIELSESTLADVYPLEDADAFGAHYGSLTQTNQMMFGYEGAVSFASDAAFNDGVAVDGAIIDLVGKLGFAVDSFAAYGMLGASFVSGTLTLGSVTNDINSAGLAYGAGVGFMPTEQFVISAEYLSRVTSEEFENGLVDIKLDTIAVRASYKF